MMMMTVLIRLPIIAQRSKGAHYFHRVVGLVVYLCRCTSARQIEFPMVFAVTDCVVQACGVLQ